MNLIRNEERNGEPIGLVFIHGAGLNSRIWESVASGLRHPCLFIDFPAVGPGAVSRQKLSLRDYTDHIRQQIAAWDVRKFVLVAHSLGGVLALRVAADWPERLVGFIAVGAAIPENGGSFLSTLPRAKRLLLGAMLRIVGTRPPEAAIRQGLCGDLLPEQATEVVRSFIPESVRVYTERIGAPVPNVPKLYVLLERDAEFALPLQQQMASNLAAHETARLETGHLPMLSRPDELRRLLLEFLARLDPGTQDAG